MKVILLVVVYIPFTVAVERIPLVRFKSIKKQLKEKGEFEEFWRNHHPDIFARRYLHCFPADIALSVGTASERLYDYMNISNISIKGQDFGESVFEPGTTFALAHFDGVLGLGYPSLAVGNALPVFDSIMNQQLVEEPVFSFYLKRGDDTENGGELILGGIDHSLYKGSIHWVPVTEKSYWQIHLNKSASLFLVDIKLTCVPLSYPVSPLSRDTIYWDTHLWGNAGITLWTVFV
ncbi:cathepsin E-A-like [Grus japonensis]|uniref:Cathepsin E-A-like n=1 Tax=Grus japonensis TaxID=30415 RepID=A0ABC9VUI1_GRUJA